MNTNLYVDKIEAVFRENGNQEKASQMKKYMKNHFEFIGIPSPERKELAKHFLKENGTPSIEELQEVVNALWEIPEREFQYFALTILDKKKKDLKKEDLPLLETLIQKKSWWDTIDAIAPNYVGIILKNDPTVIEHYVSKWIQSNNMWLQRSAILFQLKYKADTDEKLLFHIILLLSHSPEFFIRKAIGWALREYSKTNAAAVEDFVQQYEKELSNLSKREALKVIRKKKLEGVNNG
jgi:3-methyladenine DNA glycosylase AlkD